MIPSREIKNPRISWNAKVPAKVHVTVRLKARVPATKSFLVYQGDDCGEKKKIAPRHVKPLCVPAWTTNKFKLA